MHRIQTFNAISNLGLERFPSEQYEVGAEINEADAIMLRSHKLDPKLINGQLKAVARAGAGVNNIPVGECTEHGVVVFNTPGANANAVKELVLCGLLLASRGIIPGIDFASTQTEISDYGELSKLMEQEKKQFKGKEIAGKTLSVIGLGAIGSMVADMAISMGMNVQGYDPALSVEAAWRLPSQVKRIENLNALVGSSDFISLHLPVLDSTRNLIDVNMFASMREGTCLLNFARDEIVDSEALLAALESGKLSTYISDFPRPELMGRDDVISMPHIGASTTEAEENCAVMAADQLRDFLENGNIKNSVNFPNLYLDRDVNADKCTRLAICNKNVPKMLGQILSVLADQNINVIDMLNKSREEIAYNLIDLESTPSQEAITAIANIEDVVKVTVL
ncbi:MAG: phosphoglycerate dehydrogenase [Gammaproteobacteria bacterium]|jgi:D-3-phosphoglycerate dehydrogenase|nr:phosphoglycerate dehydrogenase [Gammaproteobacteria bacterium]MDP6534834.1 phosphoglycerate dehydrogenase [Gammaproteobacteria bacterium]MDP6732753.1 phosphoglycerate dehydrogenase [Gammaproteobacteria bacterium]HAJ74855.1 3-phosphoglycerate dehydrogenase [Gammaproteobacteria bacterium]